MFLAKRKDITIPIPLDSPDTSVRSDDSLIVFQYFSHAPHNQRFAE